MLHANSVLMVGAVAVVSATDAVHAVVMSVRGVVSDGRGILGHMVNVVGQVDVVVGHVAADSVSSWSKNSVAVCKASVHWDGGGVVDIM